MAATNKVLILGALGLVGRALLNRLDSDPDWTVFAVSRRSPDFASSARWIALDLTDHEACARTFAGVEFADVTHVVYAALFEQPALVRGWSDPEQIAVNAAMLRNVLDPLDIRADLRHVTVLQGTKAYGVHLGFTALPGKESQPRPPGPNFYWAQEDYLRQKQAGRGWHYAIFRPQIVFGVAIGSPMNVVAAVGAYAALQREQGLPLQFPGSLFVSEATDADLLARAIVWAGTTPHAADQTFNVTNGDVLVWQSLWPAIARIFSMPVGEARPATLATTMPALGGMWEQIRARQQLRYPLDELVGSSWQFLDAVFAPHRTPVPTLVSTIKIRQFGFHDCVDTEAMLTSCLRRLQAMKILPV